jgi:hypothetical protein
VRGDAGGASRDLLFRVDCPHGAYVARWEASAPDPGKYRFRIATGNVNLDCSIYDYSTSFATPDPTRAPGPAPASIAFPDRIVIAPDMRR